MGGVGGWQVPAVIPCRIGRRCRVRVVVQVRVRVGVWARVSVRVRVTALRLGLGGRVACDEHVSHRSAVPVAFAVTSPVSVGTVLLYASSAYTAVTFGK